MITDTDRSFPLWLELIIATGLVALAYRLERLAWISRSRVTRTQQQGVNAGSAPGSASPDVGAISTRPSQESHGRQRTRADQSGRGREAQSPSAIPLRGWKDVLWRTYNQIGEDRLLAVGAGAVFYLLLAMFPAITAFVSSYGLFANAHTIAANLSVLSNFIPQGAVSIIGEQVTRLTETSNAALGIGFFFGLALALWSANAGIKAIIDALNVVYDESEKRGFIKLNLVSFAFTLGALSFLALSLGAVVIMPLVFQWFGIEKWVNVLAWLRWPALVVIILGGLAVLYRFGPSRRRPKWRWISVGSVFAATAWIGGSALFSWYLSNFADYDATYGSLGAAIGLMMWLWLSVILILTGAELNAEIEHQTARDTTVGDEKPLGARGAVMADTVGEGWG
jgi:membrane protein